MLEGLPRDFCSRSLGWKQEVLPCVADLCGKRYSQSWLLQKAENNTRLPSRKVIQPAEWDACFLGNCAFVLALQ